MTAVVAFAMPMPVGGVPDVVDVRLIFMLTRGMYKINVLL